MTQPTQPDTPQADTAQTDLLQALATCDNEPIRTPGSIQPHGFMLCLGPDEHVVQLSANLPGLLGRDAAALLGQPLGAVLGAAAAGAIEHALMTVRVRPQPGYVATVAVAGAHYDVLAHRCDGLLMLECEPAGRPGGADFRHLGPLVGDFLLKLNEADGIAAMSALAAREIADVTGYGRVLVYRFDSDGHGHVLAESGSGALPSYLGQRFPASDIPRQARALYLANRIRLIHDADYIPAPLLPARNPLTGALNDLSFAALRSVSPVHLQYMRNMGTPASMSVSLVVKGKLWGLISCHHGQPRAVPFEQRSACEQLAQVLALRIESREDADELTFRLEVRRTMVGLLTGLTQGADFIDNMRGVFPQLLQFARAGGAAILLGERVASYGDTPDEDQIRDLVAWLHLHAHGDLYHTDQLSAHYPPAAAFTRNASGLLAMPISRIHNHYLLWFRPEQVHTIDWAGNPRAKDDLVVATPSVVQLTPRTSFDNWRETVRATSARWHDGELELALELRNALLGIALERAEQMAELAEELGRANKELEAFSYSVSHDLRAPLRHIVGFSDLLLETSDDAVKRQRFLTNIKDAARLAGKLVDDLLSFSQMGRAALRPSRIDMGQLVRSCIDKLSLEIGRRHIDWDIGPLPAVQADPAFLQLALYNLLSNAVKFTRERSSATIRVSASVHGDMVQFDISDNGVGFNMDYVHKLFGVFQRLHRMEDFHGTGIGLANVRRIVERHGGKAWASSVQDQGATFSFSLPKVATPDVLTV
jgi:light-regulated signal transduction histidine kinase (bacteriophytochrome)